MKQRGRKSRKINEKRISKLRRRERRKLNPKNRKAATSRKKVIIAVIMVCILLAGIIMILVLREKGIIFGTDNIEGVHELSEGENPEDVETQVKSSDDYVEPASGTLDIEKIQGFTPANGNAGSSANGTSNENGDSGSSDTTTGDSTAPTITLSDPNLTVEAIGRYSGNFLEDGSDEPTANVTAMLITNNSDQMLQIAEITFQVNDTETASFKVTDLPAGTSTLVLEANKREYSEEDSYTYGETATGYMEQPSLEEDKFDLVTENGKITLKNKTDQSYDKVYVYYKYVQLGGAYLGGITYRTPFENVPANGEVESIAAHFNPESSKIMAVQIQQEQ